MSAGSGSLVDGHVRRGPLRPPHRAPANGWPTSVEGCARSGIRAVDLRLVGPAPVFVLDGLDSMRRRAFLKRGTPSRSAALRGSRVPGQYVLVTFSRDRCRSMLSARSAGGVCRTRGSCPRRFAPCPRRSSVGSGAGPATFGYGDDSADHIAGDPAPGIVQPDQQRLQ